MDKEISQKENLEKLADKEALEKGKVEIGPQETETQSGAESIPSSDKVGEQPLEKSQPSVISTKKDDRPDQVLSSQTEQEVEEVEDVLEEDLADVYKEMDLGTQATFREQGEETAKEIVSVIHKVKYHAKKIIKLISKWLKLIPGVSNMFVEQEAKIKTDKIEDLHEDEHKQK